MAGPTHFFYIRPTHFQNPTYSPDIEEVSGHKINHFENVIGLNLVKIYLWIPCNLMEKKYAIPSLFFMEEL